MPLVEPAGSVLLLVRRSPDDEPFGVVTWKRSSFYPVAPCAADCNHDGLVSPLDFMCFLNLYAAGDPDADCNGDGVVNTLDVLCFLNLYTAGC